MSDLDRFMAKVEVLPNGCWRWLASKRYSGYGVFSVKAKPLAAHRWAYEHFVGPIPPGLTIDHLCHDKAVCNLGRACPHRACVNPAHLEVVTNTENVRRGNAGFPASGKPWGSPGATRPPKTRCKQGHPLSGDNLYVHPDGRRRCRMCRATYSKAYAGTEHGKAAILAKDAARRARLKAAGSA